MSSITTKPISTKINVSESITIATLKKCFHDRGINVPSKMNKQDLLNMAEAWNAYTLPQLQALNKSANAKIKTSEPKRVHFNAFYSRVWYEIVAVNVMESLESLVISKKV
jgi:hypothetical protein